jgi:hypothetical protein
VEEDGKRKVEGTGGYNVRYSGAWQEDEGVILVIGLEPGISFGVYR